MPTDIIKKVQIKNAQSGLNESYNVGAEGADVALSQTGNHIAEGDVQAAMADIYDKFYNIDTTPTLNSDDLVTSGGVAQAIKDVQAVAVGTSSTAAATAAKVVTTIKGDFELENGADLIVRFTNANTASNITMAVDGTTAKSIYYKGAAIEPTVLKADIPYEFVYDGTNYVLVGSAGGLSGFEMTEAEYDELPITDQRNPEKLFFIEDALEDAYTASGVAYDNGDSGLEAVNVQDAIDELSIKGGGSGRYGTSSTASATAAKTATTTDENFTLFEGAGVTVLFEHTDTAGSCTLSVDGTTAKPIYYNGSAIESGVLTEDNAYEFVYDGTHYLMVGSAGGLKGFEKTTAEYNALPSSDKNDENKVFFISDSNDPDVPFSATTTSYSNTESGLEATNVQDAIDELVDSRTANAVSYDNTESGLTVTNVQGALDEVDAKVDKTGLVLDSITGVLTQSETIQTTLNSWENFTSQRDGVLQFATYGNNGFAQVNMPYGGYIFSDRLDNTSNINPYIVSFPVRKGDMVSYYSSGSSLTITIKYR